MQRHAPEIHDPEVSRVLRGITGAVTTLDDRANKACYPTVRTGTYPVRVFVSEDGSSDLPSITVVQFMPEWFGIFPPEGAIWTYNPTNDPESLWEYGVRSLEIIGNNYCRERRHDASSMPTGRLSIPVPCNGIDVKSTPSSLMHFATSLQEILENNFQGNPNRLLPRPNLSDRMYGLLNKFYSWVPGFNLRKS